MGVEVKEEEKEALVSQGENGSITLPVFKGKNYSLWKEKVMAILIGRGLDIVLTARTCGIQTKSQDAAVIEYNRKDKLTRALLLMALDDEHCMLVYRQQTSREVWARLSEIHEQKSSANKVMLQREFFDLQMKSGESVQSFVARAEECAGQLKDIGVAVPEWQIVARIVSGLTSQYANFMSNWNNVPEKEQTLQILLPRLLSESKIHDKFESKDNVALIGESGKKDKFKKRSDGKKPNKPQKGRNKGKKRDTKCFICKQEGHWKKDCPNRRNASERGQVKVEQGFEPEAIAVVAESNCTEISNEWIFDTGATEHMTNESYHFVSYNSLSPPRPVRFGNNVYGMGLGTGSILVESRVAEKKVSLMLTNVLYVPEMTRKLISASALMNHDLHADMNNENIQVKTKDGRTVLVAKRQGNLYYASIREMETEAQVADDGENVSRDNTPKSKTDLDIWHARMAHNHRANIVRMSKAGSVTGLPNLSNVMQKARTAMHTIDCVSCQLGKQARMTFPARSKPKATKVGIRVHIDMCGPIGEQTISGAKYFVLLKDEFSQYRFVHFIKTKDEMHDSLRKTVAAIESTRRKVQIIVSDCGSELISKKTQEFLISNHITHETSAPFTPQQNGLIERDNRTIVEAARTMLKHRMLPEYLWGEAVNTAVYILNRVCNRNTANKTPYEIYHQMKPRVDHLIVFGSLALVKMQEKKRSGYQKKLESRALSCIHVGYEKDFTYRVFDPKDKKVIVTRDVHFDESKTLKLSGEQEPDYVSLNMIIEKEPEMPSDLDELDDPSQDAEEVDEVEIPPAVPPHGPAAVYDCPNDMDISADVAEAWFAYGDEPATYEEAISSGSASQWRKAMQEEYTSLLQNQTWVLKRAPKGRSIVSSKWVFKVKRHTNGTIERYKARLVARGYSQKFGIDYKETFSPVVRFDSIRLLLSIVAQEDMNMIHFDIKTAFLHGKLEESIFMQQPKGFEQGQELVCELKKSIYGLKQASRSWNTCFVSFLKEFNLEPLYKDNCIMVRKNTAGEAILIVALYVDDGLACSKDQKLLEKIVKHLQKRFQVTTMSPDCFVGLQIYRERKQKIMIVNQKYYVEKVIKSFDLTNAKSTSTPMMCGIKYCKDGVNDNQIGDSIDVPYQKAIGTLLWISNGTRPDIAFAVNKLASFSNCFKKAHWNGVKHVLKYLKQTSDYGLCFKGNNNKLEAYSDSDYGSDLDSLKSTSGVLLLMNNAAISWKSSKQSTVATSTTNAEFIASSIACSDIIWARQFLEELGRIQKEPTKLLMDSQGAITLIVNEQVNTRIKHIDIKYMFVREAREKSVVKIEYVRSEKQIADILTKALPKAQFEILRDKMGLKSMSKTINNGDSCKTSKLGLIMGLAFLCITTTAKGDLSELEEVTLTYDNPCDVIKNATDDYKDYYNPRGFCMTIESNLWRACNAQLETSWNSILQNVSNCYPLRFKRGVGSDLVKSVGVGVTNFLQSRFLGVDEATIDHDIVGSKLIKEIRTNTLSMFSSLKAMKTALVNAINIVSESGVNHEAETEVVLPQFPRALFAALKINTEILAGAANFRAILKHCERGQLATLELGELLGWDDMAKVNPSDTQLKGITVDKGKRTITFVYKINQAILKKFFYKYWDKLLWICFAICFSITMSYLNLQRFKRLLSRIGETRPSERVNMRPLPATPKDNETKEIQKAETSKEYIDEKVYDKA